MADNNDGWEDAPVSASHDSGWEDAPAKHLDPDEVRAAVRKEALKNLYFGHKEGALNMLSGIPAGLGGGLNFLGTLAATQNIDAAKSVKEGTEETINNAIQYKPRTGGGKSAERGIGKAFKAIIDTGGNAMPSLARSIPFIGDNLVADEQDEENWKEFGKTLMEMNLNLDPVMGLGHGMFKGKELPLSHADKIEPKLAVEHGWEDAPIPTAAHADDFAATNPYDVGGHVTASEQGRPSTIDNAQGDLFGGDILQHAESAPDLGQASLRHDTIPYEKTFPFELEPMDKPVSQGEIGLNMPEHDPAVALQPDQNFMKLGENTWEGSVGSRDAARAKAAEQAAWERHIEQERESIEHEKDMAQTQAAREAAAAKERDLNQMQAQKELDFAAEAERIQNSPARNFFLDPKNMDKLDLQDVGPMMERVIKRATAEQLDHLFNEASAKWHGSKGLDKLAEHTMDAIGKEREMRRRSKLRDEVNGVTNEIHPGHKYIPEGTMVEFEYEGEIHRAPVIRNTTLHTHTTGTTHYPRVQRPGGWEGQTMKLKPEQIKKVFGKPTLIDTMRDHQFSSETLGDKTLMSPEHTHTMVEALRKGDVHGALDAIAANHFDPAYRNLADYLKGAIDNVKVMLHDEGILSIGDRHATGYYDPASHTVGLSKVGATSPHTVLHELVHSLTSAFVNERPNDLRVMGLKDLFNKLTEMGMQKEFPAVHNVKEFLAEAFSHPEFQEYLKQHNLVNRSTWSRFVDNVKSMLGISSSTRIGVTNALEHVLDLGKQVMDNKVDPQAPLKDAGVPGKLADLMVVRDKPKPVKNPDVSKLNVPGLKDAVSDFKMEDRPMEEVIKEAREATDIPDTRREKFAQQMQAGGLFESLKTRNPVVKATYSRITRAAQEFTHDIKTNLTDPKEGLKAYMRALSKDEKGEIHSLMILHEGQRELSNMELRNAGMNDRQIAYYNKARAQDKAFFDKMNERRKELGMDPIDQRVAHMAGRFMGDFARFMFDKNGKIIGRIAGNTKWELDRATKFMQERHPDAQMGKLEYNRLGKGKSPADRFQGLTEALNFLTKTDADVAATMDSYKAYLQKDAVGYLNAVRHAKAKVKDAGGIKGSEGNKPWLNAVKNAEEGMKAQLAYFEQGYKWMAMEKAVKDLAPLLGDERVVMNTPNAVKWGRDYLNHSLGREQGPVADAANWTASMVGEMTGIGHTNIFKANALVKHVVMQKFMGLGNIPFSITQLMQPFQVHPPMMALLKSRGLEINPVNAQIKAARTYLNALSGEKTGAHTEFEKAALDYADKTGILDVQMADHTKDINVSKIGEAYSKIADLNIEIPEKLTRGTSFLFYAHMLKDAGVPVKDIFGAAENLTNFTMVNYHPMERPMGYAKLGWLGDLASTLTRYKHNQFSQAAFYAREGMHNGSMKSYAPLATFLATSLAFGGVMGFFGYQEADSAYQLASKWMGKPDTLTNVLFKHNTPELITHGIFSTLGLDMTTRFSNANMLPDSIPQALMPYGSAVLDAVQNTAKFAADPLSTTRQQQLVKSLAPQSVAGVLENQFFTHKNDKGENIYVNSNDGPNFGKGRVARSDADMSLRNWGFRDIRESKELATNYSNSQINKAKLDLAKGLIDQAKRDYMDGTLTNAKLAELDKEAATKFDMDPNQFANEFVKWRIDHEQSQADQIKMKNANGGFTGAMRIKEGR